MNKNKCEIFLETYHYVLMNSANNPNWQMQLTNYPEIIAEHYGTKNTNLLTANSKIKDFINYKNKNNLSYIPLELFESASLNKELSKSIVNKLFQKTSYFAYMIKNLLDEFGDRQRKFRHYKISPYPQKELDTFFPIKTFKIKHDDGEFDAELLKNGMMVKNSNDDEIKDYFLNRCISKHLKTAYTDNIDDADSIKKKLIFLRFATLPKVIMFSVTPRKYKVKYVGNQTVRKENDEYSISDEPINILHLEEVL